MTDELVQIIRAIEIGAAGFVLGMATLVVKEYAPSAREGKALPQHVALIAVSYAVAIAHILTEQVERLVGDVGFTRLIVIAPFIYGFGIAGLSLILKDVRERRIAQHRLRREIDGLDRRATPR